MATMGNSVGEVGEGLMAPDAIPAWVRSITPGCLSRAAPGRSGTITGHAVNPPAHRLGRAACHHRNGLDSNQRRLPPFGCVRGATPWHCRPPNPVGALPLSYRSDDGPRLSGVSSTVRRHDTSRICLRAAGDCWNSCPLPIAAMGYRFRPTVAAHLPVGGQPQLAERPGHCISGTAPADTPHAGHEPGLSGGDDVRGPAAGRIVRIVLDRLVSVALAVICANPVHQGLCVVAHGHFLSAGVDGEGAGRRPACRSRP